MATVDTLRTEGQCFIVCGEVAASFPLFVRCKSAEVMTIWALCLIQVRTHLHSGFCPIRLWFCPWDRLDTLQVEAYQTEWLHD